MYPTPCYDLAGLSNIEYDVCHAWRCQRKTLVDSQDSLVKKTDGLLLNCHKLSPNCHQLSGYSAFTCPDHNYESHKCRIGVAPIPLRLSWRNLTRTYLCLTTVNHTNKHRVGVSTILLSLLSYSLSLD